MIAVIPSTVFSGVRSLKDVRTGDEILIEAGYDENSDSWQAISVEVSAGENEPERPLQAHQWSKVTIGILTTLRRISFIQLSHRTSVGDHAAHQVSRLPSPDRYDAGTSPANSLIS